MRVPSLSILAALAFAGLAVPSTTTPPSIQTHSSVPAPPTTTPNPLLTPRLHSRAPITWHDPNSRTFVVISLIRTITGPSIRNLLSEASTAITAHIAAQGDGVIAGGYWQLDGAQNLVLTAMNANNHQTTWGVLGAAVNALLGWVDGGAGGGAAAYFEIWDGVNEVGVGQMG
ncbi:hypothetical protein MMC08_006097 [Hypocenomyce scalaris]|nr:hypothetical protein [Hypocenomyce scalaris]